jgi:hypothetical protein
LGEIKLNPWRDGFHNLWFLLRKRFARGSQRFGGAVITVVIPNWNGGARLTRVLKDLGAQTQRPKRVIVVDNGPPTSRTVRPKTPGRSNSARNESWLCSCRERGHTRAETPLVAILNN